MLLLPSGFWIRLYGDHGLDELPERQFSDFDGANRELRRIRELLPEGEPYWAVAVPRAEIVAKVALEIEFPGVGAVTWMEFRACHRASHPIWGGSFVEGEEPATLRIMPDFAMAYAWNERDDAVYVDDLYPDIPGIKELDEGFSEWQRTFEVASWEPRMPMLPGFDWPSFHARGVELARRLKVLTGDRCAILYEKPYEDPDSGAEPFRLVTRFMGR